MHEVVIIGGGLAGSAAAITLARAGRDVLLLERTREPHDKVCGEFLSQEALHSLRSLGLDPASLGARKVEAVRLADSHRVTTSPLPFEAMSLTRRSLDEALLQRAMQCGATVLRGKRVLCTRKEADGWIVEPKNSTPFQAKTVFLASGKHDILGHSRPRGVQADMVGFKMYFTLDPQQAAELSGHVELMLFRGGYAGLQLVEDGSANLGWIIHKSKLQALTGERPNLLSAMQNDCPQLAERLRGAKPVLEKMLAISPIPYGYVRRDPADGHWSLGDQAAVIPSFTGDGMSIALHSGQLAAAMYLAGDSVQAYQQRLHAQLSRQVAFATVISRGMVSPVARKFFMTTARVLPGSLALIARLTRIPTRALFS
jgi:flavin-dependent dehydrogenase